MAACATILIASTSSTCSAAPSPSIYLADNLPTNPNASCRSGNLLELPIFAGVKAQHPSILPNGDEACCTPTPEFNAAGTGFTGKVHFYEPVLMKVGYYADYDAGKKINCVCVNSNGEFEGNCNFTNCGTGSKLVSTGSGYYKCVPDNYILNTQAPCQGKWTVPGWTQC